MDVRLGGFTIYFLILLLRETLGTLLVVSRSDFLTSVLSKKLVTKYSV